MSQKSGERAYAGRLGNDWSPRQSRHVWMTPADQGLFSGVAPIVGAVMSPAFWCGSVPLALMLSADPLPQSFHRARTGAGGSTGFRINPLPAHHLLVTLDSCAALV